MTTPPAEAGPRGFLATITGGLIGGTAGVAVGLPIANANDEGGLEAVATVLIILFLALCVGAAAGAGIALAIRHHNRPVITALLALPAMFFAAYIAVWVATRVDTALLLAPLIVATSMASLAGARALAIHRR